jgi:hypothetical protein
MSNIVIESVIGADGTLHLEVPIGMESANQPVRVLIQAAPKAMTKAEWAAFMRSMAGSITDPRFERPPQLPLETVNGQPYMRAV